MGNITRRDFLKGGIAGAATLAASELLNAISAKESVAFADEAKDTAKAPVPAWTELNPQDESYDTYTTDYSAIFTPIKVGPMTLRNRIVKSSAGSDTLPRDAKEMSQNDRVLGYGSQHGTV